MLKVYNTLFKSKYDTLCLTDTSWKCITPSSITLTLKYWSP